MTKRWSCKAHVPYFSADAHYRVLDENGAVIMDGIEEESVAQLAAAAPELREVLQLVTGLLDIRSGNLSPEDTEAIVRARILIGETSRGE